MSKPRTVDLHMLKWATPLQADALKAVDECGSSEAAANKLGISRSSLRNRLRLVEKKAAAAGYAPDQHLQKYQELPPGQHLRGVSYLYRRGEDEPSLTWVKGAADYEDKLEALREALEGITDEKRGAYKPLEAPRNCNKDLLNVYPVGDAHIGMMAWAKETGVPWDLAIARREITIAVDGVMDSAPPAEHGLVIILGDWFHTDNSLNRTLASGHVLDVDSRYPKMCAAGLDLACHTIDRGLQKHRTLEVWVLPGNHDQHTAIMMGVSLSRIYQKEKRLNVVDPNEPFAYKEFGSCLIASTHGHTVKGAQLPNLLAQRQRKAWGRTKWSCFYLGHVHHMEAKEYPGCIVEYKRAMCPKDGAMHSLGYESDRDITCDTWHRDRGRIGRVWQRVGSQ